MQEQIAFYERKLSFEMDPADLWEALENGEEIVPIDTRQTFAYEKEHIPTAMNLPHREMSEERTKHLDRSKLYVTYCDGIG
ncbi:MAG: rhodanese-like domain-containing protein, partial [Bacteroidota bacterium]